MKKPKINWFHLVLGVVLNVLVAVVFYLIYYAYIVMPQVYNTALYSCEAIQSAKP